MIESTTGYEGQRVVPLSPQQAALWLAQRLNPDVPFVVAQYADLKGPVDTGALADAARCALREFDVATGPLVDIGGAPHQVLGGAEADVPVVDVQRESDPVAAARRIMLADYTRPVTDPDYAMFASFLLRIADDHYWWYARAHHAVLDGYAAMQLMRRTTEVYRCLVSGDDVAEVKSSGLDGVIEAETTYRASRRYETDGDYWRTQADRLPPPNSLAGTIGRPTAHARVVSAALPDEASNVLQAIGDNRIAATLIAAFATYLSRMLDVDDLVLGLPVAARTTAVLRRGAGSTANVVPLVLRGVCDATADDVVQLCSTEILDALRHQRFPRHEISASDDRLVHFGPVVNLMMFRNEVSIDGVRGYVHVLTTGPTVDLSVNIYPGYDESAWRIDFEANADPYSQDVLVDHHRRFLSFLGSFAQSLGSDVPVGELELFQAGERRRFVPASGEPGVEPELLPDLFASRLAGNENRTAVSDDRTSLTYDELDKASNRLARALISRGIGPESFVVVAIPRSIESVTAVWAVAKAGAAFAPVDPTHPLDRLQFMITDSGARLGLAVRGGSDRLPDSVEWLFVDDLDADGDATTITDLDRLASLRVDHPAYMIYTSGTTGTPKGVVVTHRGLANLACDIREKYAIDEMSRVLHFAAPIFDTALVEILAASLATACLVVAGSTTYGGTELHDLLCAERVTHLLCTPSVLATLDHSETDHLRLVLVGGEACPPLLARRWAGTRTMRNAYGPTETTCSVTLTDPLDPAASVSIGHLMRGVSAVVLDHRLQPCPPHKSGDLYLATSGIARGYHHRADLTATRFVAAPFADEGTRMFYTGDIVSFTGDGQLEFHGRRDTQVKIRGFRIELGEIDGVLTEDPSVQFAVTIVHENDANDRLLVSYVLPARGKSFDPGHLRQLVRRRLPAYMVPASVVEIATVPLTPTNKLDVSALPPPTFGSRSGPGREPADEVEQKLIRIVGECLHVGDVSVDDSFFDLGGDSLSATRLVELVNNAFDIELTVRDIFDAPVLADLIDGVRRHPKGTSNDGPKLGSVPVPEHIPLAPAQSFIDRSAHAPALYNLPFTIRVRGPLDIDALRRALVDVLNRHTPLRTIYPDSADGPVQRILDAVDVAPKLVVLQGEASAVWELAEPVLSAPFDVRIVAPIRAQLFELAPDDHLLACAIHHIAADGWSLHPMAQDLIAAYLARAGDRAPDWAPLAVDYTDYTVWHHARLGDENDPNSLAARQIGYWRHELADLAAPLELDSNRSRPDRWTYGAGRVRLTKLAAGLGGALRATASKHRSSLYVALLASVAMLLADVTRRTDIAIGTPIAGRSESALDGVVGMFVNTLVLRVHVDPTASFDDVVDTARAAHLRGLANADIPFDRLVQVLDPPRSAVRHPFFQVAVSFDNFTAATLSADGLGFELEPHPLGVAKCDLHFHFAETDDDRGVACEIVYSTDVFDGADVAHIVDRYEKITSAIRDGAS
ncbi:amino acid adenylation domain-containing protein [Antrihabitans stalactiti]|uniref:amino acid adenylation domain-containing protein n=1 Tax=Antrihabitans stalactiti TaxID=2584121 RepID=UPI0030B8678D